MPKQIITIIGLILSLGIVALGIAVVAVPLYTQSVATDSQTATVASSNAVYQSQIDHLTAEDQRIDEINASVASLQKQIPATDRFDDVFEVVAKAADSSGVVLQSITVGDKVIFVQRTAATESGQPDAASGGAQAPAGDATGTSGDAATSDAATNGDTTGAGTTDDTAAQPATGRQQVDFTIVVTAAEMKQASAFLDALRKGPRLLSSISATTAQTGTAIDVQVGALAFVDSRE